MFSNVRRCKWIALHMSSPEKFWVGLADAMGRPDFLTDDRFCDRAGRIKHNESLISLICRSLNVASRAEWCAALAEQGVPYSPVYTSAEALEDRQAKHLGIQVEASHPTMGRFRSVRFPVNFDGQPISEIEAPPVLGEHDADLRAQPCNFWRDQESKARPNSGMKKHSVDEPADKLAILRTGSCHQPPANSFRASHGG